MSVQGLEYRERRPAASLQSYVLSYWEFVAGADVDDTFIHHVMPDGCVSLVKPHGPFLTIVGPRLDELRVPVAASTLTRGVRFWPGATEALLHIDGRSLRDAFGLIPDKLAQLFPRKLLGELDRCATLDQFGSTFDAALEKISREAGELDRIVSHSVAEIMSARGQVVVSELAHKLGLSERQLQRRFRKQVGLTPKQFARIRRFRSSVEATLSCEKTGWASVAYQYGYADQAHLCREYGDLVGLRPDDFKKRVRSIRHIDVQA